MPSSASNRSSPSVKHYDVVVVGAGVIGQSMALGASKLGLNVAVLDKMPEPNVSKINGHNTIFDTRVSAISSASQALLERLGAWKYIARKQPYTDMHVFDQDGFGSIDFSVGDHLVSPGDKTQGEFFSQLQSHEHCDNSNISSNEAQGHEACLGHIIENSQITYALHQSLAETSVDCFYDCEIDSITSHEQAAEVLLKTGKLIHTNLLIGADGANSLVKKQMGFTQTFWDYDQTAIVANLNIDSPHEKLARQVFTPYGPLAFLPLPDPHQVSIVFSQRTDKAKALMNLSSVEFEKALRVAINNYYGAVKLTTKRMAFPLTMRYSKKWTCEHIALMGDAAHTIHPLAGQGANLGLADVQSMLENFHRLSASNKLSELGSHYQLRKYERERKAEALKVIAAMESFKQLFDTSHPVRKLIRNAGLASVNRLPFLKSAFIKLASS